MIPESLITKGTLTIALSGFPFIMQMSEKSPCLSLLQPTRTMNGSAGQCLQVFSHLTRRSPIFAASVNLPALVQGGQAHGFRLNLITPRLILPGEVPWTIDQKNVELWSRCEVSLVITF